MTDEHKPKGCTAMKNNITHSIASRPVRPSFPALLEQVKGQVDFDDLIQPTTDKNGKMHPCYDADMYFTLCRIIADMYAKQPTANVKIEGAWLDAATVQDRYRELNSEHITHVVEKFKEQTGRITKIKPYLQNMLFNAVDEIDAYYTNLVNHDMASGKFSRKAQGGT